MNIKCILPLILSVSFSLSLFTQPKYRTFSQADLSLKKVTPGKALASSVCFVFKNDSTGVTVNGLSARFNSSVVSIQDAGGFSEFSITEKGKVVNLVGGSVESGDSVTICAVVAKKAPGTQVNFWWWEVDGEKIGTKRSPLQPVKDVQIFTQPNGGNVRDYIYKKIIRRPEGLVLGIVSDSSNVGWIRYMKADRKYFPHFGGARCFEFIATGSGVMRPFIGELKNPHVKKHDNHLLGELHALKLAIIANDSGVTEPLDTTAFGELIYNDLNNPSEPFNGMTIRQIAAYADSALTYCNHFDILFYEKLDTCISRINSAFSGEYIAVTINPLVIAGTHTVDEVQFLHPNPSVISKTVRYSHKLKDDNRKDYLVMSQNYPNPFNPTTSIEFYLEEPSIVTLRVYNLIGEQVAILLDSQLLEEGIQYIDFDASNLPAGIYFYKVFAQGVGENKLQYQILKKMVLMK